MVIDDDGDGNRSAVKPRLEGEGESGGLCVTDGHLPTERQGLMGEKKKKTLKIRNRERKLGGD